MKRPTYQQVADEARVGTATVERVLNGRGGVAGETAQKVVVAAKKLGWGQMPAMHRGVIRIEVILVRADTPFYVRLNKAFERISASLDSNIVIQRTFVDENDPVSVARHIEEPGFRRSGLIVVTQEHPAVRKALLRLKLEGHPVVQIVNGLPGIDLPYVGVDNYAAGRTAAYFMSKMLAPLKGTFLALCHSSAYYGQTARMLGFSDYLADNPNKDHEFPRILFGFDSSIHCAEILEEALNQNPYVIGLYNAGGGESGVAAQLEKRRATNKIYWVNHEINDKHKKWLKSGLMSLTFDSAPDVQARRATDTMLKALGIIDVEVPKGPVHFITAVGESF
ncbi:LacI family DNA-binding transcriptional regulator [Rhizobium sp. NPDC090275]|uniref:LacI family DNA-binding transcriptional regulator n=1 Tax=Rhizobium sp. NPDC090275 TaxID=3364498 RepID=UPI00383BD213